MEPILTAKSIYKSFQQPDKTQLEVLTDLSLEIEKGKLIAITGVSGSGKSTLLHLLGGLDTPDKGEIYFNNESINAFNRKRKNRYRNRNVGFIFQFHYLMPELNVLENVAFPYLMHSFNKEEAYETAGKLLREVGLTEKQDYMPYQLSGGERQRAAIARGLINTPDILLADEPTGNLDWKTGEKVFAIFQEILKTKSLTAVIVTHNEEMANMADHRYHLHAGQLAS